MVFLLITLIPFQLIYKMETSLGITIHFEFIVAEFYEMSVPSRQCKTINECLDII